MTQPYDSVRTDGLPVKVSADGIRPLVFRWCGEVVRVLSVEGMGTCGAERHYRVRTVKGRFVLAFCADSGIWRMRRQPTWLERVRARWQDAPRYPLPAWRRRTRQAEVVRSKSPVPVVAGGSHADWLVVVR